MTNAAKVALTDPELEMLLTVLADAARTKAEALETSNNKGFGFTPEDFGIPQMAALYAKFKNAYLTNE